jgi:uncharacterized protein (TIGR01777 family)
MRSFTRRSLLPANAEEVFRWHERPGAFERLNTPWEPARVLSRTGGLDGGRLVLRVGPGPLKLTWIAQHQDYVEGRLFRDVQVKGPFSQWTHTHSFEAGPSGSSWLEDRVDYDLPLRSPVGGSWVAGMLEEMFTYRHRTTEADLRAHAECRGGSAMKVVLTGSSGLIGGALVPFLTTGGHEVVRLVRSAPKGPHEASWDPSSGRLDPSALAGAEGVVHLAGESIADGRWSAARKARLRTSRLGSTRLLAETLAAMDRRPRVLVCASAIGYYGDRADALLTEASPPGEGFLAELCQEWEEAAEPARRAGIRVVHLRIGIVLSPSGGALGKMLLPFKLGAGGRIGEGRQYMSFIGLDDLLDVIHRALTDARLSGPVNAVSPQPVTNREFTRVLGRVLGRPTLAPVPALAVRLAFGEMADELLLSSTRVAPARLLAVGHAFRHPDLEGALRHLLGRATAA